MGIPGMLIGVPLVAAIYKLVGEDMDERLAARAAADALKSTPAPESAPVPEVPKPEPIKVQEPPKQTKAKKKKKKK